MSRTRYLEEAEKLLSRYFSGEGFSVTREIAKPTFDQGTCDALFVRKNEKLGRTILLLRTHVTSDGTVYINSTPLGGGSRFETVPTSRAEEMQILEDCALTHLRRIAAA